MKINIAYALDDKYSTLALVSMISALETNKNNDVEIIILYSKLKNLTLKSFETLRKYSNCILRFVKVDEKLFEGLPISFWVTVEAWFRVKIAELCPDLDKVLYVDCDTLIINDLSSLFVIELKDNLFAGILDIWDVKNHVKRLNILDKMYFNSGVLLINCSEWRKENYFEKIYDYAIKNERIIECSDQDVLNKIADGKKLKIPPQYDFMETWWRKYYNEYENEDLINYNNAKLNPVIIHFTGLKPNYYKCLNSFKIKWWEYAKMTTAYEDLRNIYLEEEKNFKIACKKTTILKFLYNKILWKISFSKYRKSFKIIAEDMKDVLKNYKAITKSNFKLKKSLSS